MVLLAALATFSTGINSQSTSCPSGRNYTTSNETGCCEFNITCGPGTAPVRCNGSETDLYGYCQPCPYYCCAWYHSGGWSYNSGNLTLDTGLNYCRTHTHCSAKYGTRYAYKGNSTNNSICHCLSGFYSSTDFVSLCFITNTACPEGQGVDYRDGCLDCVLGETYSDRFDDIQECTPVTTCSDYECTLAKATVSNDTVCGPVQNVTSPDKLICASCSVWNRFLALEWTMVACFIGLFLPAWGLKTC